MLEVSSVVSGRPALSKVVFFVRFVAPKASSVFSGSSQRLYVVVVIGSSGRPSSGCAAGCVSHGRPAHSGCSRHVVISDSLLAV